MSTEWKPCTTSRRATSHFVQSPEMKRKCVKSVVEKLTDHAFTFNVPAVPWLPYASWPINRSVAVCHWLFTGACRTQTQLVVPGPMEFGHVDRHCTSALDVSVLMNTFAPPYSDTTLIELCELPPA